jgi:hypothetical protein
MSRLPIGHTYKLDLRPLFLVLMKQPTGEKLRIVGMSSQDQNAAGLIESIRAGCIVHKKSISVGHS